MGVRETGPTSESRFYNTVTAVPRNLLAGTKAVTRATLQGIALSTIPAGASYVATKNWQFAVVIIGARSAGILAFGILVLPILFRAVKQCCFIFPVRSKSAPPLATVTTAPVNQIPVAQVVQSPKETSSQSDSPGQPGSPANEAVNPLTPLQPISDADQASMAEPGLPAQTEPDLQTPQQTVIEQTVATDPLVPASSTAQIETTQKQEEEAKLTCEASAQKSKFVSYMEQISKAEQGKIKDLETAIDNLLTLFKEGFVPETSDRECLRTISRISMNCWKETSKHRSKQQFLSLEYFQHYDRTHAKCCEALLRVGTCYHNSAKTLMSETQEKEAQELFGLAAQWLDIPSMTLLEKSENQDFLKRRFLFARCILFRKDDGMNKDVRDYIKGELFGKEETAFNDWSKYMASATWKYCWYTIRQMWHSCGPGTNNKEEDKFFRLAQIQHAQLEKEYNKNSATKAKSSGAKKVTE